MGWFNLLSSKLLAFSALLKHRQVVRPAILFENEPGTSWYGAGSPPAVRKLLPGDAMSESLTGIPQITGNAPKRVSWISCRDISHSTYTGRFCLEGLSLRYRCSPLSSYLGPSKNRLFPPQRESDSR
jgi:hypothetical protein